MTNLSDHFNMADRTFAERLRAAIDADPDLTPAGLATKAGLDNSTIRQLLSGKANNPRVDTAMRICAALGTTLEEFLGLEYDPVQREIVRLYMQLSVEERRLLLGAAQGIAALHQKTE
jgi:transcriptional regulator with XRE-family HTH domain